MRIAALAAVLALVGYTIGVADGGRPGPKTHTVTIEAMKFHPEHLSAAPGDRVIWVNRDLVPHTATSSAGGFDSKAIQANQSWEYRIQNKGKFAYVCAFHPTMTAIVEVK